MPLIFKMMITVNQDRDSGLGARRYGMFVPLVLLIASLVSSFFSYSSAKKALADDLNNAMLALANDNSALWTRPDTIAALRLMREATHKPMIYRADDLPFRNSLLKREACYTLALVDGSDAVHEIDGGAIVSDTIMLVAESAEGRLSVQVQGFAICSAASVFASSDQALPGFLFALALLSMAAQAVRRRRAEAVPSLEGLKLTPMQRQLTQLLLDAPGMRVDKAALCSALWGNKCNAEESLYTLVRRTKAALADANFEIVCNRGESYELRVKG